MRGRRPGLAAIGCLTLAACGALQKSSDTLSPLPTTKPVIVPTSTMVVVDVTPLAAATTLLPPATTTTVPETTTTEPTETSTTSTSTTTAPRSSTSAPATSTTSSGTTTTGVLPAAGQTWIMQIGSAPSNATPQAVAAQLAELRQISPATTTLYSGDWPKVFNGENRVIFYVGGFNSRNAVKSECTRLGLLYPDDCLARELKR